MIKKKPKSAITSLAWHPNSQILAVGSYDYRVRLYSALVKAVDKQAQTSAWGSTAQTGELLQEFQTGRIIDTVLREERIDLCVETGWTHDVAFSPSGEKLAWVSHNSMIFAASSSDPTRVTMETTNYLPFRCIIFVSESTLVAGVCQLICITQSIIRFPLGS